MAPMRHPYPPIGQTGNGPNRQPGPPEPCGFVSVGICLAKPRSLVVQVASGYLAVCMPTDVDARYSEGKRLLAVGDAASLAQAAELFAAGAAANHLPSQFRLGELLLARDDQAEQARGGALIRKAAEAGHPSACLLLGLLQVHGGKPGIPRNPAAAARWCEKAAKLGSGVAQFNLGLLYADGFGVSADAVQAVRWLRQAAHNGIPEAAGCIEVIYRDFSRPQTWDEAETRASVALHRTDPDSPKTLRFAEYYIDPCLDLVAQRFSLRRDEIEDIVQQFFLELEEPLRRGELTGRPWKESIRRHYTADKGRFRPYLGRVLVNFVQNYMRDRTKVPVPAPAARIDPACEQLVEWHAGEWSALLARFTADTAPRRADAGRATEVLTAVLVHGATQAELAARLDLSERTIRSAMRLGTDLLREWLGRRLDEAGIVDPALREGLELLPAWLHHPAVDKRNRALLLLVVVERRIAPRAAPAVTLSV